LQGAGRRSASRFAATPKRVPDFDKGGASNARFAIAGPGDPM